MTLTREALKGWRADRMAFRQEAILLESGLPFGKVIETWQSEDFRALDSGIFQHAYLERPRGHSKTGDIGTEAVAELILGPPGQRLFCCAADLDQASLLFEDVVLKFKRSPLLCGVVKVTRSEIVVKATGSRLRVLAADAPSAYGLRPDWVAVDEISEWGRRDLWDSLWSATGKRPNCRMLVISSAGWDQTSIAAEVRRIAEAESNWYFSSRGQCASWISQAWLEQQRRTLPAHVFARLHENRWVENVGAFLSGAEVSAVFAGDIPSGLGKSALGLDLGVSRDRTVAAVVHRDGKSGLIVVDALTTWRPKGDQKVELADVEEEVAALAKRFGCSVYLDPWQGILMSQRLRARGINAVEYPFTSDGRRKLFGMLLDLIRRGRLRCRPHEELRKELLGLEVEETAAGWRVDHKVGRFDDHVVAVGLAAQAVAGEVGVDMGAFELIGQRLMSRFDSPWFRPSGLSQDYQDETEYQ